MKTKNIHFWHYWNGWVKITLSPGQSIELSHCEPTDEGYSFKHEVLTYTDGGLLHSEYVNGGRDCDGYISHTTESIADSFHMHEEQRPLPCEGMQRGITISDSFKVPSWVTKGESVYDQFAQSMNY